MQVDDIKTFTAGEALAIYRRVKVSAASTVIYADAEENAVGITQAAVANGDQVAVRLINRGGSFMVTALEAMAVGAKLYGEADGKVSDTDTAADIAQGLALEASTADGDIIECLIIPELI